MCKRKCLLAMVICMTAFCASFGAEKEKEPIPGADMPFPMGVIRSVFTIAQTPLELPRAMVFCTTSIKTNSAAAYVGGSIGGIIASPFFMFTRCLFGTIDLCSLGLLGDKIYMAHFTPMIWHATWINRKNDGKDKEELAKDYAEATKQLNAKNYGRAFELFLKCANKKHASAQNDVGYCYQFGYGVEKDYKKALEWYHKSADQNNSVAQGNIAFCYENGYGVVKDYQKAAEWYRKSADQGNKSSQFNLGWLYINGHGVKKDYVEGVKWYRKAADQGHLVALNNLGHCYENGFGVERNMQEAANYYRKAAEAGNHAAQANLGRCYLNGRGVTKDRSQAIFWLRRAARKGNKGAQNELKKLNVTY